MSGTPWVNYGAAGPTPPVACYRCNEATPPNADKAQPSECADCRERIRAAREADAARR